MRWLEKELKDYCYTHNIQLLRDDLRFIDQLLRRLPYDFHKCILSDYIKKWEQGMGDESNATLKQNSGRKMANNWIRDEAAKIQRQR